MLRRVACPGNAHAPNVVLLPNSPLHVRRARKRCPAACPRTMTHRSPRTANSCCGAAEHAEEAT